MKRIDSALRCGVAFYNEMTKCETLNFKDKFNKKSSVVNILHCHLFASVQRIVCTSMYLHVDI